MKDWQFWTFIAFFWIAGGILAPFPLDIFFFIGAFAIGIAVHFIQRIENNLYYLERKYQRVVIEALFDELAEIKKLLEKKRDKKRTREVKRHATK